VKTLDLQNSNPQDRDVQGIFCRYRVMGHGKRFFSCHASNSIERKIGDKWQRDEKQIINASFYLK